MAYKRGDKVTVKRSGWFGDCVKCTGLIHVNQTVIFSHSRDPEFGNKSRTNRVKNFWFHETCAKVISREDLAKRAQYNAAALKLVELLKVNFDSNEFDPKMFANMPVWSRAFNAPAVVTVNYGRLSSYSGTPTNSLMIQPVYDDCVASYPMSKQNAHYETNGYTVTKFESYNPDTRYDSVGSAYSLLITEETLQWVMNRETVVSKYSVEKAEKLRNAMKCMDNFMSYVVGWVKFNNMSDAAVRSALIEW